MKYFKCPNLNAKDADILIHHGKVACKATILNAKMLLDQPIYETFFNSKTRRRLKIRLGRDCVEKSSLCMSGHTQIRATIEDVANFFHITSTSKRRQFVSVLGDDVLDMANLYVLADHTEESPLHYVGIDWFALKTPPVIAHRDFCLLEVCRIHFSTIRFVSFSKRFDTY